MNVYQRYSPKQGLIGSTIREEDLPKSPLSPLAHKNGCPPAPATPVLDCDPRRRHFSGSTQRSPSILTGIRGLIHRQRSESLNVQLMKKPLRKVQIAGCKLDSVYDLREGDEGEGPVDFYDDERAFRRPRSNSSDFLILRKTSRPLSVDVVGLVDSQTDPYRQYMKVVDCYELAPLKANVVMFDKRLTIAKAFEALCEQGIGAGLVWDADQSRVTSIVTFTDFFLHFQKSEGDNKGATIESILTGNNLVTLTSNTKIFNACEEFSMNRVHRLVIVEASSGDVQYLLTIKRVLQAIHKQNRSLHFAQWLTYPIKETGIGVWNGDVFKVKITDTVEQAVQLMIGYRVSSLPVVNEEGEAVDVLHKSDIAHSTRFQENPKEFLGTCTVREVLPPRNAMPFFARPETPVSQVLDALLCEKQTRCLFVLDGTRAPSACISLSDILFHLLYDKRPFGKMDEVNGNRDKANGDVEMDMVE